MTEIWLAGLLFVLHWYLRCGIRHLTTSSRNERLRKVFAETTCQRLGRYHDPYGVSGRVGKRQGNNRVDPWGRSNQLPLATVSRVG